MAEQQTDQDVKEHLNAEFKPDQEYMRHKEVMRKYQKRIDVMRSLVFPLCILSWLGPDLFNPNFQSRFLLPVIVLVVWIIQIEYRMISVERGRA